MGEEEFGSENEDFHFKKVHVKLASMIDSKIDHLSVNQTQTDVEKSTMRTQLDIKIEGDII